jgi:hypothetical protein
MRHHLSKTGLSLSQAQSISNLCYQRALEINNKLSGINNATKTFKIGGDTYTQEVGKPMPKDVADLLQEKAKLHATQAFLMVNIKAKDHLLIELRMKSYVAPKDAPEQPSYEKFVAAKAIGEDWGWDKLTSAEYAEYIEAEAYAAHIGQFIHKDSILDGLRKELPKVKALDWITIKDGERTPIKVEVHHTSEELLAHHETLATLHRKYEQRVNYYKAKVKNLVTEENARIAKENAVKQAEVNNRNEKLRNEWNKAMDEYSDAIKVEKESFEADRQEQIKTTAAMRIQIDPRFQATIDQFLKGLEPEV